MNFLNKSAYRILGILFTLALFVMLLQPFTDTGFVEPLSVIVLAVGLFFALRFLYRWLTTFSNQKLKWVIFAAFILFIGIQIFTLNINQINVFGDPWHISVQAQRLVAGSKVWDTWMQTYPNLLPLTLLNAAFIKIASFLHLSYFAVFWTFNLLLVNSIWLVILRFLWAKKPALATFIFLIAIAMPMNYTFLLEVGYSDGIALLALTLLVVLFDKAYQAGKISWLSLLLAAICFAFAYLARPNSVIFIIALAIVGIYAFLARKKMGSLWRISAKLLLACFIGILLAVGALHGMAGASGYNLKNKDVLPAVHWIYMGMGEKYAGEYNPTDLNYSLKHEGYSSASAADIAGIKSRIVTENVKLPAIWLLKFGTLWSSGTFATGTDYQMYAYSYRWVHAPSFIVRNIAGIEQFLQVYAKALMAVFLFAITWGIWRKKQADINTLGLMLLTIMGTSLFHSLVWEVKPRYQFITFTFIILAAAFNFGTLFGKKASKESLENEGDTAFDWPERHRNLLKIAIPILSVLSLLSMSTLMRAQDGQKIAVTAMQHPTNNYAKNTDILILEPGQTLTQQVDLPVKSDKLTLVTWASGDLKLQIQKKVDGKWKTNFKATIQDINERTNQLQSTDSQDFFPDLSSGTYRISITNPTQETVSMKGMIDTGVLDYPHTISLDDGQKASFGFSFFHTETSSRYPLGMIGIISLLLLLSCLAVFFL